MEFLHRSSVSDGPLVAFGASDGTIRVLSMLTWKVSSLNSSDYTRLESNMILLIFADGKEVQWRS